MTDPDPTRERIHQLPDDRGWSAWIPPRNLGDYDGDAIRSPYGDSYWPTRQAAEEFVRRVHFSEQAEAAICVWDTPSIIGHVVTVTCTGMKVAEFVPLGSMTDHDIMLATASSYATELRRRYVALSLTGDANG